MKLTLLSSKILGLSNEVTFTLQVFEGVAGIVHENDVAIVEAVIKFHVTPLSVVYSILTALFIGGN